MSSRFSLRRNRRQPPKESRKNYSKDPKFYDDSSFTVSIALITSACKRITTRQPIIVRKLGRSNEKNEQAIQLPQYLKEFDDDINKLLDASENIRKHFGLDRTNETQPKTSFDRKTQDRASTGQLGEGRSRTGQGQWGSESKPFQREYGSTGRQEPGSPDVDVVDQSSERGSRENRGQATDSLDNGGNISLDSHIRETGDLERRNQSLERKTRSLENDLYNKKSKIKDLEISNSRLQDEVKQVRAVAAGQVSANRASKGTDRPQLQSDDHERKRIVEELQARKNEIIHLQNSLQDLGEQLIKEQHNSARIKDRSIKEQDELRRQIEEVQRNNDTVCFDWNEKVKELQNNNRNLWDDLQQQDERIKLLKKEITGLQQVNSDLNERVRSYGQCEMESSYLEDEIRDLKARLRDIPITHVTKERHGAVQGKYELKKVENRELRQQLSDSECARQDLEYRAGLAQARFQEMVAKSDFDALSSALASEKKKYEKCYSEAVEAQRNTSRLEEQNIQLHERCTLINQSHEREMKKLIKRHKDELQELVTDGVGLCDQQITFHRKNDLKIQARDEAHVREMIRRELQKDHTSTETFERLRKQYEQMKSRNEELEDKFQNQLKTTEDLKHKLQDFQSSHVPKEQYDAVNRELKDANAREAYMDIFIRSEDILATYVPKTDYDMINGKLQEATRNEEKHKDKIVTLQRERDNALNSRSDDLRSLQQQLEMSRGTLEKREQELQAENKKLCDDLNTAHKQNDATSQWLKQKLAQSNAKYEDACAALQRQMEESASHLECVTATYKQKLESENAKLRDVTEQLRVMKRKYDEERSNCLAERREKDDALTRLSAIASARLRDNNPNITDLSDMNRPTKLGEKSAELYDNEWTDAYDALEQNNLNDVEIVKALLEIFTGTFIACKELAGDDYLAQVQAFLEFPGLGRPQELPDNIYMPDQLQQQVKEYRKLRGPGKISEVAEMLKGKIHLPCGNQNDVQKYFKKCVELCWLAVLQDPPLDVDTNVRPGDKFDSSLYRDYTARGPYVEYVVWPAIRLHKNGPLLAKGVAQGCKTDPNKN